MNVRRVGRDALWIAVIALLPLAWLAWQPSYVHRSALDPTEPIYASNYLQARGYIFPWLITEVPADLGPVPFRARVMPGNLARLYVVALFPVVLCWILVATVRRWLRRLRPPA